MNARDNKPQKYPDFFSPNHGIPDTKNQRSRLAAKYDRLSRTRLSPNFILRDFMFCAASAARGMSNYPEHPEAVIYAGQVLCLQLLEPLLVRFGRFAITYGYQSRESMDHDLAITGKLRDLHSSSPHHWDRQTFGDQVYARVDILPFCVEDGAVSKHEFGHWLMHNLDVDLCMSWTRSNVFCLTVSPKPRRCWVQWGRPALGEPKQETFMGIEYWREVFPTLPENQRPRFFPSSTNGAMHWRGAA